MDQAPFGSFFLPEKSSAEGTVSGIFTPKPWHYSVFMVLYNLVDQVLFEGSAIYISTAEELALFAYNVNNGVQNDNVPYSDRTVVLQDDIDLSGANWTPIGTESAPFTGEFDGSGCTITGLRVIDQDCSGLFGVASNAVLSRVVISDATISSSAFLADPYGSGTKTGSGFNFCGVLAGTVIGESLITDCSVSDLVSGKQYTGRRTQYLGDRGAFKG